MKTQSITSVIAVLGATAVLNLSALAGPGADSRIQARNSGQQQSVSAHSRNVPTFAFGGTKSSASESSEIPYVFTAQGHVSAPTLTPVVGPHGTTYLYRW